jgi:predicted nucleotidyltransferase
MESESARSLIELEARRNDIVTRIVSRLEQDERVIATWLTGSFGRGEDDAWSDLDLHVAVEDAHLDEWWQARESLYAEIAPLVFIQREMPANAQEGGHFQLVYFRGLVEVDWNVGPVSLATMPATSQMLFARQDIPRSEPESMGPDERRDRLQHATEFFWAMSPIAVKYCGRGATTEAVSQIDLLIGAFIEGWHLLHDSANLSSKNPRMEPALSAILPRMGSTIDPARCLEQIVALTEAMRDLRPELETAGVCRPTLLVSEVETMVEIARDVILATSAAAE